MAQLDLYPVLESKTLIAGAANSTAFVFPALHQGDTTSLSLTLLKGTGVPFTYGKVNVAEYSIRLGIFTSAGTTLTTIVAASWTADPVANKYTAILPLNTVAIDTAITAASGDITGAVIEIEITETATGAVTTVYRNKAVVIEKDFLSNATQSVAAGETAATQAWTVAGFVPLFATRESVRYERTSTGKLFKITRNDDGFENAVQYTPPP